MKCDNCCNPCRKKCCEPICGCPTQILDITTVHEDTPAWLRFNLGGKSIDYDFTSAVKAAETDTSMHLDVANRNFVYNSERHKDSFSASELGSILHIADIGDVDIAGVTDNSLFVFQKNSDCGEGCEGINNSWVAWNSSDHLANRVDTLMGFNGDGKPQTLNHPTNTTQFYNLAWNGSNKISFAQPTEGNITSGTTAHLLFEDQNTKQPLYMKVTVTIAGDGTITLKKVN
jgi:hypothetical protein